MGKLDLLTEKQRLIFDKVSKDATLNSQFYFTGGTALSVFYLQHRESEDLDFFSEKKFDSEIVLEKVSQWSKENNYEFKHKAVENVNIFSLTFDNQEFLKIDFNYYPHKRIEKELKVENIEIDSLIDIATNKLLTINQRTEVKDFVDLYFLLQQFTFWDLLHALRVKFGMKNDPFMFATDFMKVEGFEFLPKMLKPLTLLELQEFFKQKAKELAKRVIE